MGQNGWKRKHNYKCLNFIRCAGECKCKVKMDIEFCSKDCAYATNTPYGATAYKAPTMIVDGKRKVRRFE